MPRLPGKKLRWMSTGSGFFEEVEDGSGISWGGEVLWMWWVGSMV